jgi:hypothetical protein
MVIGRHDGPCGGYDWPCGLGIEQGWHQLLVGGAVLPRFC